MEILCLSRKFRNFSGSFYLDSFAAQSPYRFQSSSSEPKPLISIDSSYIFLSRVHAKTTFNSSINSVESSSLGDTTSQSALSLGLFERYNGGRPIFNRGLLGPQNCGSLRSFSASSFDGSPASTPPETASTQKSRCMSGNSDAFKPIATPSQVSDIINFIQGNEDDLESKLDLLNVSLSNALAIQIFRVLNTQKISAFRFFKWIRAQSYKIPCNSDIYSLLIDNFGRLDDYEGMLSVLTDFRLKGIGLNHKAFGFLHVQLSTETSIKHSIRRLVELLDKVGGSCRISGIIALIQMFCSLGSFEMAKFVIEVTERRTSFYNVIVREKCRRSDFEGARDVLNEMKRVGCGPDVGIHNYLLSSLCKNNKLDEAHKLFEEMPERGCPPNSLTFEVLICHMCETSNLQTAFDYLEMMYSRGLEPRLSTHAAFVKCYINSQRYKEADRYAVDSSSKHSTAQNAIYSLLARLYEKRGDLAEAQCTLSEMMDAGLRPNFPVYMRVLKKLQLQGRGGADALKDQFSNVSSQFRIETG